MRLSCPGCGAVYEAPIASIGPAGRLVECGACGRRWRAFPTVDVAAAAPSAVGPALAPAPVSATVEPGSATQARPGVPPALATSEPEPPRSGGAFMAGFALVASAALIGVVVYARHDGLAAAAPAFGDAVTAYAGWVDARREDLKAAVAALRAGAGG
jgi:predicted Zn finger-like uncharacterized protein